MGASSGHDGLGPSRQGERGYGQTASDGKKDWGWKQRRGPGESRILGEEDHQRKRKLTQLESVPEEPEGNDSFRTEPDRTEPDRTGTNRTGPEEGGHNLFRTKPDRTGQTTGPDQTGPEPTEPEKKKKKMTHTGPNRTGPNRTGTNRTGPNHSEPDNADRTGPEERERSFLNLEWKHAGQMDSRRQRETNWTEPDRTGRRIPRSRELSISIRHNSNRTESDRIQSNRTGRKGKIIHGPGVEAGRSDD